MFYKEKLFENFENGIVNLTGKRINTKDLPWNPSPVYKGVSLKHIITGAETNNSFSAHLVEIEPGCEIGLHTHQGKTELHEIVSGSGFGYIENNKIPYKSGVIAMISADKDHFVKADENGLCIFAKFFPALL